MSKYYDELKAEHADIPDALMGRREGEMLDKACAEVDRLRADTALAIETITKCNEWINAAKPLLEIGGKAANDLTIVIKVADKLLTDLENVVEGLDAEEAAQVKEMRAAIDQARAASKGTT